MKIIVLAMIFDGKIFICMVTFKVTIKSRVNVMFSIEEVGWGKFEFLSECSLLISIL